MKTNSLNNSSAPFTIDPGSSADTYTKYSINGTDKITEGVVQSTGSYHISSGGTLGTNSRFIALSTGESTEPIQSAFSTVLAATASNVTGDGTVYTVAWDTEIFDQNGDLSGSTFTAPVSGKYRINGSPWVDNVTAGLFNEAVSTITTSNRTFNGCIWDAYEMAGALSSDGQTTYRLTALTDMDAGDTCTITITISGSTKTINVSSVSTTTPRGYFMGSLIC